MPTESCDKMLFTTLYFHMFQLPLDGCKCCVSLWGDLAFFSCFKPPRSHLTLACISRVLLAQTSGALMVVSQKSCHQKAVGVVCDQSAVIRWGQILTLWRVSDTTDCTILSPIMARYGDYRAMSTIDFVAVLCQRADCGSY